MKIGIPKEIKAEEHRVAATPQGVALLVKEGHAVTIETGAGIAIGYDDASYRAAGANVAVTAAETYSADLIFKVKEPQPSELALLHPDQILFCYLHLAAAPELARALLERETTAIAFETVLDAHGATPLLAPMSRVAGRMAIQVGMQALEMKHGGRGTLLSGVPGVPPGKVVIIGGGQVGASAARIAVGIGAEVILIDRDAERLNRFDERYNGRLHTRFSNAGTIEACVTEADLVVGAVYQHGRRAPCLLPRELVRRMPRGSAIVDVAIDQGGCAETSRLTTHSEPTYVEEGVVHYCVTNMPAAAARTATQALANATAPFVRMLADKGAKQALQGHAGLRNGLNVCLGRVTEAHVAEDLGYDYLPPEDAAASLL